MKRIQDVFLKSYIAVARSTTDDLYALAVNRAGSSDTYQGICVKRIYDIFPPAMYLTAAQALDIAVRLDRDTNIWTEALSDYEDENDKETLRKSTLHIYRVHTVFDELKLHRNREFPRLATS